VPSTSTPDDQDWFLGHLRGSRDLAEGMLLDLLGEISLPPWLGVEGRVDRDPLRCHTTFAIEVVCEERVGPLLLPRLALAARLPLPDSVLQASDVSALIRDGLCSQILSQAHLLYERDPRIGWSCGLAARLPSSPLFDPADRFPRTRTEIDAQRTACPLCGASFAASDVPCWAGGNLLWTHEICRELS